MKAWRLSLLAGALLAAIIPVTEAAESSARTVAPAAVNPSAAKQRLTPMTRPVRQCRDLAAHAINFHILARPSQFTGTIEIRAVVRNVGSTFYQSRPGQQVAYLYEDNRLVSQVGFYSLGPGNELRLPSHRRSWDASSASQPTYRLQLSYDPDIASDGNPNNDDCNPANDVLERSGTTINALFRP